MMGRFDEAKFALEAATGGKNTLLFDDLGMPSVMVRIPCFRWSDVVDGGEDAVCSAFIVGGQVKDCIYISKYLNIIENGRAYSLPDRDPAHTLTIDEARTACAEKGPGWHLMSNAEWMAIAHWCRKNETVPHGNNYSGCEFSAVHEHGVLTHGTMPYVLPEARTLTGSGPNTWSHDWSGAGICDLNGNVWDFVSGLRVKDGELQVIPENDSALNVDESDTSPYWKAIDTNGRYVAPKSPNTYKYDSVNPGNADEAANMLPGGVKLSTVVSQPEYTGNKPDADYHAWSMMPFRAMTAEEAAPPHILLKELGLFPVSDEIGETHFFIRNYGERIALRGGSWLDKAGSGVFELYLRDSRGWRFPDVGFRAAFVEL
jgi:hypothetical protein